MVWNQLCRQRKPDGAQAGLKVLVGMLQEPKKDGHEPAIVILATLCNERQYATAIAKVRKLLAALCGLYGSYGRALIARAGTSSGWT